MLYIVYDFSVVQDEIDMHHNLVDFKFSPGIKCVANKTAMDVFATVINEWRKIYYNKENDVWRKEVSEPRCGTQSSYASRVYAYNLYYQYSVSLILENGNGDVINKKNINVSFNGDTFYYDDSRGFMEVEVKSQKKYFEENDFEGIRFYREVSLDDIVGDISLKIKSITSHKCSERSPLPKDRWEKWERKVVYREPAGIFSIEEWNEFINNN